jgi:hypothetical protein
MVFVVTVGAVNRPVCVIVPDEAAHETLCAAPAGDTLAEHWLVSPEATGLTQLTVTDVTAGGGGGTTLTLAVPSTESSTLVAVNVTDVAAAAVGAVNTPEAEIVPLDADQVTALLKLPVPLTSTVQVSDAPEASGEAQLGTTEVTLEAGAGGSGVGVEPPPHPKAIAAPNSVTLAILIQEISLTR